MARRSTRDALILAGLTEDTAIVPSRSVMHLRSEQAAEQWLRQRIRDSRSSEFDLRMFARARPGIGESELDAAIRELARGLATGQFVAVQLSKPLPELVHPPVVNLSDLVPDEPATEPVRPAGRVRTSWISFEVIHEFGLSVAGMRATLVGPGGQTRDAELDDGGRWRLDDVPTGWYHLRLRHETQPERQPRLLGRPKVKPTKGDETWHFGSTSSLRLHTGENHRIVIVEPRAFAFSV